MVLICKDLVKNVNLFMPQQKILQWLFIVCGIKTKILNLVYKTLHKTVKSKQLGS